ncbi:ribosome silencing factor [Wolbachia endosymbiont of Dipetalonema caudispina]|uniref:ribosome silencing factor n=1 Tax=Wolbachia endosymbiont of Dipetalonema caudispina TaxID=1812112 RepID=UPI00158EFF86|nr:ribosome silencing factor [Wolbachia endosymbiont of Dipetalonema caudispina]QKX01343.1 ribosome silencing factor [Wolbachia endosymbiont of Dipetalonema caudispina]
MPRDLKLIRDVIVNIIDQNKGYDITIFNVQNKTIIAKYMVIASGNSNRHVKALAEDIINNLKLYDKIDVEGMEHGNWVIVNFQNIMVHIFRSEVRKYYKIEELWGND